MKALLLREIKSFFGSPTGYLVIAVFLILNGLFLWVFDGEYNLLNSGFADMTPFFKLTPIIFLFLIPAVTMRSFSDERKQGTLELLFTKPLSDWEIVNGKFLGSFFLIIFSLLPTLIYIYVLSTYGSPQNNLDYGSIMGSYFGLLFLISSYCAIGIFTSTLTENQIVAFLLAVSISFLLYFGFEGIATAIKSNTSSFIKLGMDYHYKSMSRGVLDTRDVIYFCSITFAFLSLTVYKLKTLRG